MNRVLHASMALAWLFQRPDAAEAALAQKALTELATAQVIVPALWFAEIANGILCAENKGVAEPAQTSFFLHELSQAEIETDEKSPQSRQTDVLSLARAHGITANQATYLDLAIRRAAALATFDWKLAGAARTAGVKVFGDPS